MFSDDHIRTARAVRYLKANSLVITAPHGSDGTRGPMRSAMGPPPRPRPRPQNARFPAFFRADTPENTARASPGFQNTQTTDLTQRIGDWERQCSPNMDGSSMGDKQPWRLPEPIWAPAKFPQWSNCSPPPPSCSPSPPRSPSPPLWRKLPGRIPAPSARLDTIDLYATSGSPPVNSDPVPEDHLDFIQRPERSGHRQDAPISALTAQLKGQPIARNLAEADALRKQMEKQSPNIRREEEQETNEAFLREILKKKEPQVVFEKNFSFGPKLKEDSGGCELSLSPRSSRSMFPGMCSQAEQKSLKRQRHDSSNGEVMAKSPRAQLHSTTSPIPIQPPQSKLLAQRSLQRGFGTPEVHIGQLIHLTTHNPSDVIRSTEDKIRYMASHHRLGSVMDSCKTC